MATPCARSYLSGIVPAIPPKANRKNPPPCDCKAYKDRNRIEHMFNRLKQFRRKRVAGAVIG